MKSRRVTERGRVHRGVAYFLPKVLIKVSADLQTAAAPAATPAAAFAPAQKTDHYSIQVEQITVPDPRYMYALSLKPAPQSSDHFNLVVNANGFLSSVNASNEDRTGQIVEALAQTAANAFEASAMALAATTPEPLPKHLEYIFDPSDPTEIQKAKAAFEFGGHQLIDIECVPLNGLAPARMPAKKEKECDRLTEDEAGGVFYRNALPYILSVKPLTIGENNTNIQQVVMLPNQAPIFEIDVRRAPFVGVNTAMTFTNGYLTSLDYTKPSEIEGFVSIPLELSKMALSVPTNLLQLKIDLANKGNELLEAQKKAADDRAALLSAISNLTYTTRVFQEYVRTN
jgi:hypothetical protein